jgi:hypothetical protein
MKTIRTVPIVTGMMAWFIGVHPGVTGNDTGGIIPWSPENEVHAPALAQAHCARFRKYARATSIVASTATTSALNACGRRSCGHDGDNE